MAIVEESLDEAEFLWALRAHALDAHDQNLERVRTWTEDRLRAALDGVVVGGDGIVDALEPALRDGPPARASVAAYTLSMLHTQPAFDALMRVLPDAPDITAIRRGLELGVSDLFLQRLQPLASQSPRLLALLTDLRVGQDANAREKIPTLWANPDDDVKAATIRLTRTCDKELACRVVLAALPLENPEIRLEAIELGLMHGMKEAWTAALAIVNAPQPGFGRAAIAVASLGSPQDHDRIVPAYEQPDWQRDALFASGFAGTVGAADACLAAMKKGILPRVAAESFCTITGLDLAKEKMIVPEPPEKPVSFEDDDLDADLVPSADDLLPMPDIPAVEGWWTANRKRFPAQQQFIAGQPWSLALLHQRLLAGPMRRRHGWAFEVAMHTQGAFQICTRAFMTTQQSQLAKLGAALPSLASRKDPWIRH